MKTLIFLKTHFINDFVLDEFEKLEKCNNDVYKAVLFIDNHTKFLNTNDNGRQKIKFREKPVECYVLDEDNYKEFGLPYYTHDAYNEDFGRLMWYCCDYPFYIMQKVYPKFDYYWQIESDVFMNGDSYEPFLKKFENNDSDLIGRHFKPIAHSDQYWGCKTHFDWVYFGKLKYGCLFPVIRASKEAVKFCYKRRKKLAKVFEKIKDDKSNSWTYCENFMPIECALNGFKCEALEEENLRIAPKYEIPYDIPVGSPDFALYHPVKCNV